ncbi:MAG: HAD family hydrolase [Spirochaetaceae bacterium]|nr:HAD family hydrolase [Spirochaetaceae bacterium]
MLNCKEIEAVIFDVDGTLYPNYKMCLTSILFFIMHPVLSTAFGRMRRKVRKIDYSGNLRELQINLFAKEIKKTEQEAAQLMEKYIYGQFISMFKWIKPHKIIKKMLADLKSKDIKVGIISDFPVGRKLSYLGLDSYWDIVCSADEIGALKPRPESFNLVASKLGITPEKIIYVGNNYQYDIIGANNAGMISAYFSLFKKKNSRADYTFYNYRKFWEFVLNLNKKHLTEK